MERQDTEFKKTFANHINNKRLVSKMEEDNRKYRNKDVSRDGAFRARLVSSLPHPGPVSSANRLDLVSSFEHALEVESLRVGAVFT